jgi:hypothetical protein
MKLEVDILKKNMKVIFKPMSQLIEELGFNKRGGGDYTRYSEKFKKHRELVNHDMVWHMNGTHVSRIIEVRPAGYYNFKYEPSRGYNTWCANCSWVLSYSKDGVWYTNEDYSIDFDIEELFLI